MPETINFNYAEFNNRIIEGDSLEHGRVARELIRLIEISGPGAGDPLLLSTLITGYENSYAREDISTAHEFAIGLSRIGNEVEAPSRIIESSILLGMSDLRKAEQAAIEKNYRRASNKAVWASERLSEARRHGAEGLDDKIMQAATLTVQTAALNRSDLRATEDFEDPLLTDLTEDEVEQIRLEIINWRKKLYDICTAANTQISRETSWSKWLQAYDHALVMQKYGTLDYKELLDTAGIKAFEAAVSQDNHQMASYIASFKLTHLSEAEQWELIGKLST